MPEREKPTVGAGSPQTSGDPPEAAPGAGPEPVYAIQLSTGQWYRGRDDQGQPEWTRVPRWAAEITDPAELAQVLEHLENSDLDYRLLQSRQPR